MTRRVFVFLACASLAAPAGAFVRAGVKQTLGSEHYAGTSFYGDFGGDFHVRPSYSQYRSDTSSGTYRTVSTRFAYDQDLWGAGVTLGGSPKVNGYSNRFFGADVLFSLSPTMSGPRRRLVNAREGEEAVEGAGLARVDLGAGMTHTVHREEIAPAGGRRPAGAVDIGQTDLSLDAGVEAFFVRLGVGFTKSRYNRDLDQVDARSAQITALEGLNSLIQGFPDNSVNLRLETSLWPLIDPYVSYTRTKFRLGQPSSHSVTFGASLDLKMLEANASYERYEPGGGQAGRNYFSLGAGVRF